MGAVITVADAARVIGAISATVKRRMLALPESVAADLAALDTEAEVSAFLADRITEALRELADAIPKLTRSDRQQPEPAPEDPDAD
jgi:chromosomal replication initiation ATPase DnaA